MISWSNRPSANKTVHGIRVNRSEKFSLVTCLSRSDCTTAGYKKNDPGRFGSPWSRFTFPNPSCRVHSLCTPADALNHATGTNKFAKLTTCDSVFNVVVSADQKVPAAGTPKALIVIWSNDASPSNREYK